MWNKDAESFKSEIDAFMGFLNPHSQQLMLDAMTSRRKFKKVKKEIENEYRNRDSPTFAGLLLKMEYRAAQNVLRMINGEYPILSVC